MTKVKRVVQCLPQFHAVFCTASKARNFICGNVRILERCGESRIVPFGYVVMVLLFSGLLPLKVCLDDLNAPFGNAGDR